MGSEIAKKGRSRPAALAFWAALAASTAGCAARNDPATPRFLPGWGDARQALVSALTAWRDAPSPLPASFNTPSVQFVDTRRRPDQRLIAFQVLGQSAVENARQFMVRLNLEGEESPQLVKYNIVGRDPVWVFRLESYEMISHWEHDMDEPAPGSSPKPKTDGLSAKVN
jgi:hypothetical protein